MFQSGILEQNITKKMFCLCFFGGGGEELEICRVAKFHFGLYVIKKHK